MEIFSDEISKESWKKKIFLLKKRRETEGMKMADFCRIEISGKHFEHFVWRGGMEKEEEEEEEEKGRKRWISIVINGHDYLAKLAPLYANQPCRHPRPAHNTRASILLLHLYEPF